MPNAYGFQVGQRWSVGEATAETRMNVAREHADHLFVALNKVIDSDEAEGLRFSIGDPMKVEIAPGTIWALGWWVDSTGYPWLLGRGADVSSFTRDEADFYIPIGDIEDVADS